MLNGFTQVYEEDIRRNYFMVKELLIALQPVLSGGLPWLRDFEASGMQYIYIYWIIWSILQKDQILSIYIWPALFVYIGTP